MDVGQLFLLGFAGKSVPDVTRDLLQEEKAGGVILFSRNIHDLEQVVELGRELCALGSEDQPTLVSVDQEGGRVARLRGICTDVPAMRTLGALTEEEPDLPYRVAAMMAREMAALGFHLDFAPVVDVDTNPDNPVIGERSFGRHAQQVARDGAQFIRGLQQAGVAASAKHFPGHGDTHEDSHRTLPIVPHGLDRLARVELPPFQAAIDVGVATIMTAHVRVPALDADLPATLSPAILTGLLRQRLGYEGVIVSDDLEMAAVADHWPVEELVRLGLLAGVDLFLICHDAEKQARAIEATRRLVERGDVPRARVAEALARVAALKARFVGAPAPPSLAEARAVVGCGPHRALMARFAGLTTVSARPTSDVDVA